VARREAGSGKVVFETPEKNEANEGDRGVEFGVVEGVCTGIREPVGVSGLFGAGNGVMEQMQRRAVSLCL
jgi:hypothetical protein